MEPSTYILFLGLAVKDNDSRWRPADDVSGDPLECLTLGSDGWYPTKCDRLHLYLCESSK